MMTYTQIRDILKRLGQAHQEVHDYLDEMAEPSADPETRHNLKLLRRHTREMQVILAEAELRASPSLLNTWMQYVPDEEIWRHLEDDARPITLNSEELTTWKVKFDEAVCQLVQQLAIQTSVPNVEEFFSGIASNIKSRIHNQSWEVREF